MPGLADLAGLAGSAVAIATALLSLPGIVRLRRAHPGKLLVAAFALALVPVGELPAAGYLRGTVGDLSVTTVTLLLHGLLRPVVGGAAIDARSRLVVQVLVAAAGAWLYPSAFAVGPFDPYRLGYGSPWFLGGLLALALAASLCGLRPVALGLSLAVLAWALGLYESRNLWDYLVDPLVAAWGIGALLLRGAATLRGPRADVADQERIRGSGWRGHRPC